MIFRTIVDPNRRRGLLAELYGGPHDGQQIEVGVATQHIAMPWDDEIHGYILDEERSSHTKLYYLHAGRLQ